MKKMKLDKILVQAGLLTDEQLEYALSEHKKTNMKLGQYLVREGTVSESRIVDLLCSQLNMEKYRTEKFAVDPQLADIIPAEMAYRHQVVPLHKNEDLLMVAMIARPHGMILSTGPTGSGKSTSLYSILKEINQPDINIITVEDPVECRIDNILQVQLNRKAGMNFAEGLRSILRQDPDVTLVGEIRDYETASVAVQAALTGHLVLSTLHTNDAASAVTRLIDMGIEPFLVSSVMAVSFAQRLVRKVCPDCKTPYKPSGDVLNYWKLENVESANFVKAKGCFNCMHTGLGFSFAHFSAANEKINLTLRERLVGS